MKVKPIYKAILIAAITLFSVMFLVSFLLLGVGANGIPLFTVPIFIIWLLMAVVSNHKRMWGAAGVFFAVGLALGAVGAYINGRAPIGETVVCWMAIAYFAANVIVCAVWWKKMLLLISYRSSEGYKEYKGKRQKSWDKATEEIYGVKNKSGGSLDFKAAVDERAARRQGPAPASPAVPREYGESAPAAPAPAPVRQPEEAVSVVDVNACPAEELMALPGISPAAANRAVSLRREAPYASADDFIQRNEIKPHFAVQILPRITAEPAATRPSGAARHRGLDI